MNKLGIDTIVKDWIVSLPYNDIKYPNEIYNINYTKEGNIFLYFDYYGDHKLGEK